ncbi:hypothetical protein [Oligoflexus tunisiensis]|uniref:hypothetical protein n=1 Tax=Oligoflexus tunisiensis TaxID=708132 RepID=UPI00114C9AE0|nr:hypothetical protein [Oligoflexus tunisiensis]
MPGHPHNLVHFDIAFRKDSDAALRLISTFEGVFRPMGMQVVVEYFPWRRGIEELKNKRLDGSIGRVDDLVTLHGVQDYVRLDVPLLYATLALWCNKDARRMKALKQPRVAYLESSMLASRVVQHIQDKSVQVSPVHSYRNMLVMMQRDRMDCLLASAARLEVESPDLKQFPGIFRHNLVTMPAYVWLAKKHESTKSVLEKELRQLVAEKEWKRNYFEETARCGGQFEQLCPDGRIFTRQLKVNEEIMAPAGASSP